MTIDRSLRVDRIQRHPQWAAQPQRLGNVELLHVAQSTAVEATIRFKTTYPISAHAHLYTSVSEPSSALLLRLGDDERGRPHRLPGSASPNRRSKYTPYDET